MPADECTFLLSLAYDRAMRAASNGDARPAVLLSYRYP